MGEIATIKPPRAALTTGNGVAAMVPNTIESAWRLSEVIAASGMAPKTYGTDPNKIMVGMLAGLEIGLTPFAALQSIAVINGNPSLWGDGALALIQASNLLEDMDETDDGHTATCTMKRAGRATAIVRTFSMDDAKKAGLVGKAGPWTQYTRRMRQMRARSIAMRDGFADVLKGLRIAEEVRDYADFADATARPAVGVSVPLTGAALLEQAAVVETPAATHDLVTGEIAADEVPEVSVDDDAAQIDPRLATLYRIKAEVNAANTRDAIADITNENGEHFNAMTVEQQAELTETVNARWAELGE
jgi:hypothetical protein